MTRPATPTQPHTPTGHRVIDLPETDARTAFRLPEIGKTFVGNRSLRTEVYLLITQNGRVEIKVKRDGVFINDIYLAAE